MLCTSLAAGLSIDWTKPFCTPPAIVNAWLAFFSAGLHTCWCPPPTLVFGAKPTLVLAMIIVCAIGIGTQLQHRISITRHAAMAAKAKPTPTAASSRHSVDARL